MAGDAAATIKGDQGRLFSGSQMASLAAAAHELKTPLATTSYLAQLLSDNGRNLNESDRIIYLEQIRLSAQRGMQLVDGITQLFNTTQIELELEPVNVANVCEDVLQELTPLVRELGQKIEFTQSHRGEPLALAHHTLLRSVLTNLCDNAIKHNPQKQSVHVALTDDHGHIRVAVRDNGPRMLARDFKVLKRRLGREIYPIKGRTGSSGLGLYIAAHLTEAMKGKLELVRHHKQGATFALTLQPSYQLSFL
jgi:signal transduction histidine kinase